MMLIQTTDYRPLTPRNIALFWYHTDNEYSDNLECKKYSYKICNTYLRWAANSMTIT